ncbi:hypothetical protein [Nocardia macrotermitis]|uniref:Uncharacterized protein n=1 Tax=Nocardia macrotermitis TaxID=2585198 RepID=A0A7K0D7J5_9NOCA|nr:hypothetical protein [Nocardia macrotermitis]MQY21735.1 hypothetical protein [Nocardia macrotermitis]
MSLGDFIDSLTSQFSSSVSPTQGEKDAQTKGVAERDAAQKISNSLGQNYHGEYLPETVAQLMENFDGMSHDDILKYRDSIDTQGLGLGVDAWNKIADDLHTKATLFQGAIEGQINDGWTGATADSAKTSVRKYADDVDSLKNAALIVGSKVSDAAATLTQVKNQLPDKAKSTSTSVAGILTDAVANAVLPGAGVATTIGHHMTDKGRESNAQSEARDVMNQVYAKYLPDADKQVPKMPGATKSDNNSGGASGPTGPSQSGTGTSTYNSPSTTYGPSNSSGASSYSPSASSSATSYNLSGTSTNSSTSPSSLNLPDATTGLSSSSSPTSTAGYSPSGSGTAGTTGMGGFNSGGGLGSSIPGTTNGTTTAATAANAANKSTSGLGSNMMPHGQKKDGEGDKEHKTADYLRGVQEELLGPEERLLPGGVIGGDYEA